MVDWLRLVSVKMSFELALATVKLVELRAGSMMAVDDSMATMAMLLPAASVTATVLLAKLGGRGSVGVVTPLPMVMVQVELAARVAVPAVSVIRALLVPELEAMALNEVTPHPVIAGVLKMLMVYPGRVSSM